MKFTGAICIAFVLIFVSSLARTNAVVEEGTNGVCVPGELKPCIPAVQTGSKPTTECCGVLKKQQSCLCGYIKDPRFGQRVTAWFTRWITAWIMKMMVPLFCLLLFL
ncbi:unnamed protein product [Brassica rapa]|uniref:Bifunctional inhibitor/plant lipid transfer protein/seed storage helical domain-containing protein n=2 Tax=Brassica TaxID=3705 RepID=A0A8D9D0A9_BRACM|nr:unnamed protein product [Brassica napus]CAG7868270.1 unnamed protein product [Brassica rapa]